MVRRFLHLVRRFFESLWPGGPSATDDRWVRGRLNAAELVLWQRMVPVDRRHAARVARRVDAVLDPAPSEVLTAALLHDVGKTDAALGTLGRAMATVAGAVLGAGRVQGWSDRGGLVGRIGVYVDYPNRGVDLLERAGSAPFVIAWSQEHHRPPSEWSVDAGLGRVLAAADDEA